MFGLVWLPQSAAYVELPKVWWLAAEGELTGEGKGTVGTPVTTCVEVLHAGWSGGVYHTAPEHGVL
jgi:hypothetical protein